MNPPRECLTFELPYQPPLPWTPLLRYLAGRAWTGVEAVDERGYRRICLVGGVPGWLAVTPLEPLARVRVSVPATLAAQRPALAARIRAQFDLDAVPALIDKYLADDPNLKSRIETTPGLRVPGAFDPFELAIRAILGQQVSVAGATTLAGRLAARFGDPVATPYPDLRLTPVSAPRLAQASVAEIAAIGLPQARARTVQVLAEQVARGAITLDGSAPVEATMQRLKALPGIGDWTAQYIALRALHWADAFPEGDLGLQKAVIPGTRLSAKELKARAEAWRPWRAYAAIRLWCG